jgi:hypothetical protein
MSSGEAPSAGAAAPAGAEAPGATPAGARSSADDRGPVQKPSTHPGKHNFLIWRVLFEVRPARGGTAAARPGSAAQTLLAKSARARAC